MYGFDRLYSSRSVMIAINKVCRTKVESPAIVRGFFLIAQT